MSTALLRNKLAPWVFLKEVSPEELEQIPSFYYRGEGFNPLVRVLRGRKMRTLQGLMNEIGASLQFFEGFGENWHGLKECLCYMDEWLPAEAYVLVVTDPLQLLAEEDPSQLQAFLTTLSEVGDWWSRPVKGNGRFDRQAVPFHVVMREKAEHLREARARFPELPLL